MARAAGIQVIGTASARHADAVTALGAIWIDYHGDVPQQVRAIAPDGVGAVFDHVGGPDITASFDLLADGGTLVSYGTAATKNDEGDSRLPVLKLLARLLWWNMLPNKRSAHFYNLRAGRRRMTPFRARIAEDLTQEIDHVPAPFAARPHRPRQGNLLAAWLAVSSTAALFLDGAKLYWALALAGGGSYLLAAAIEPRRIAAAR